MMKILKHLSFIALSAATLSACAEPRRVPTKIELMQGQSRTETQNESVLINGETPQDFYKHFFFLDTPSCDPNHVWYTMALTDSVAVGKDDLGRTLMASTGIIILRNNVYYLSYEETAVTELMPGGFRGVPVSKRKMRGTWRLDKETLLLEGLGTVTGLLLNGKKAMRVTYERDFVSPGLKNQSAFVHRVHSTNVDFPELSRCRN
jgi:hypothetical protein